MTGEYEYDTVIRRNPHRLTVTQRGLVVLAHTVFIGAFIGGLVVDQTATLLALLWAVLLGICALIIALAVLWVLDGERKPKPRHQPRSSFGYAYCGTCMRDWPCPDAHGVEKGNEDA